MTDEQNRPNSSEVPATESVQDSLEPLGSEIGPYKLLQKLGEGGMGVVYMAEQDRPVRRRVALKIIKPGTDTKQVVARFDAERQALSMMDHPNIAHVLDVGATDQGRPYFVMELVKGLPITQFCDEKQLNVSERLQLFTSVCDAVQHAHQKGVIHRDLKSSNILVGEHDDQIVPKIIDFGLAKALNQRLTDKTMFTQVGQVVGTLEYMSPEQSKMNQLDVDTRTDIYSLGVVLYELLSGHTPFEKKRLRSAAFDQVMKIIREEEPPKPSTRVSTLESDPSIAANRSTEPRRLTGLLRGDLDWIVMKALAKERSRRYDTAHGFAADIQRHLDDEPVMAGPPSAAYRVRKFARKNRRALSIAAAMGFVLVMATVVSTWQAMSAFRSARTARDAEAQAKADREKALAAEGEAKRDRDRAQTAERRANDSAAEARWNLYIAHIEQVQNAWKNDDVHRARKLLDQYRNLTHEGTDLRGIEWFYWNRMTQQELRTIDESPMAVSAVAFSPDGSILATAEGERGRNQRPVEPPLIRLWEVGTGRELAALAGHEHSITTITFSPDGQRLASASEGTFVVSGRQQDLSRGSVRIWDVETQRVLHRFAEDDKNFTCIAFSPNGNHLAAGVTGPSLQPGRVIVWEVNDGTVAQSFALQSQGNSSPTSVAYNPDGNTIAVAGSGLGGVQIYDPSEGALRQQLNIELDPDYRSGEVVVVPAVAPTSAPSCSLICYHPDGNVLASDGYGFGSVLFWDLTDGSLIRRIRSPSEPATRVQCLAASSNGQWLASTGQNIRVWSWASGNELNVFRGHTGSVRSAAFTHDGLRLASGSDDRTARIWDMIGSMSLPLFGYAESIHDAVFDSDGIRLAASLQGLDPRIVVWDTTTGKQLQLLDEGTHCVDFSPNGKHLATASRDNAALIWSLDNWEVMHRCGGHTGIIENVVFSPDSKLLASGSGTSELATRSYTPGELKVWNVETGDEVFSIVGYDNFVISATRGYKNIAFDPESARLAAVLRDSESDERSQAIKVWDTAKWKEVKSLPIKSRYVRGVEFSPDGTRLASAFLLEGVIKVWNVSDGQELVTINEPGVMGFAFDARGNRIISQGPAGTSVWASATGERICTFPERTYLPLSRDSLRALGLSPRRVNLWDMQPQSEASSTDSEARRLVGFLSRRPLLKVDVVARLGATKSISGPVRERALALAQHLRDEPQAFHAASWEVVQNPNRTMADYARALDQAEIAVRLDPSDANLLTARGVAEYRAEEYERAINTLGESSEIQQQTGDGITDLACLAMAHYRNGDAVEAKAHLEQAHQQASQSTSSPRESRRFLLEADALILE